MRPWIGAIAFLLVLLGSSVSVEAQQRGTASQSLHGPVPMTGFDGFDWGTPIRRMHRVGEIYLPGSPWSQTIGWGPCPLGVEPICAIHYLFYDQKLVQGIYRSVGFGMDIEAAMLQLATVQHQISVAYGQPTTNIVGSLNYGYWATDLSWSNRRTKVEQYTSVIIPPVNGFTTPQIVYALTFTSQQHLRRQ